MRCPKCKKGNLDDCDSELICEKCGAAFGLEYLGWYPDGAGPFDRIDAGFEEDVPDEVKKMWEEAKDES